MIKRQQQILHDIYKHGPYTTLEGRKHLRIAGDIQREMLQRGLIERVGGRYQLTEQGIALVKETR